MAHLMEFDIGTNMVAELGQGDDATSDASGEELIAVPRDDLRDQLRALTAAVSRVEEKVDKVLRILPGSVVGLRPLNTRLDEEDKREAGVVAKTAEDAVTSKAWIDAKLVRRVSSKGFGFVRTLGVEAFLHCSVVAGSLQDLMSADLVVQLERDEPRGADKIRVVRARRRAEHEAILARERAAREAREAQEA